MLNLKTLFKNHFNTSKISDDKLKVFSEDHIQRLIVNNDAGIFTGILNDTISAHTKYFGAITDEATNTAIQKARTKTVDTIIENFKNEVSRREGTVRSVFGKDSPEYLEFFPQGISEYTNAIKENIETLMKRIVNTAKTYETQVGKEFVEIFTKILADYIKARGIQLGAIGEVAADKTETEESRNGLETQLYKNIGFIIFTYPGNISRCMDFFDQSIIRPETKTEFTLNGNVSDNANPVAQAEVSIKEEGSLPAKSDANGNYTLNTKLKKGTLVVKHPDYETKEISYEITEGDTLTTDVQLVKKI